MSNPRGEIEETDNIDTKTEALQKSFYNKYYDTLSKMSQGNLLLWKPSERDERAGPFSRLYEHFDYFQPDPGLEIFSFNLSNFIRIDYNICQVALAFNHDLKEIGKKRLPHVLFFKLEKDMGGFSSPIDPDDGLPLDRQLHDTWSDLGCAEGQVFQYLTHPTVKAVVTSQFQIYNEKKIHSLPLGIASDAHGRSILRHLQQDKNRNKHTRSQLAMIHADPHDKSVSRVLTRFQKKAYTVENTYNSEETYFENLARFKFILSSKGTSFDSHQHWEAMTLGCIPVIEHFNRTWRDGWFQSFDGLPVAWIDSYENLSLEWLENQYRAIIQKADSYKFEKVTKQWWIDFINSKVVKRGN